MHLERLLSGMPLCSHDPLSRRKRRRCRVGVRLCLGQALRVHTLLLLRILRCRRQRALCCLRAAEQLRGCSFARPPRLCLGLPPAAQLKVVSTFRRRREHLHQGAAQVT